MNILQKLRQLVRGTLHRIVLPSSVPIADYRAALDALEVARALIIEHHNCSKQIEPGCWCPHCTEADGSSPKLDMIYDALAKQNPESTGRTPRNAP